MQLGKRALEGIQARGSGLQEHDDLTLVGNLALPAIERSRAWKERTARNEPSLEQGADELHGLVFRGNGRENDDGVSVQAVDG